MLGASVVFFRVSAKGRRERCEREGRVRIFRTLGERTRSYDRNGAVGLRGECGFGARWNLGTRSQHEVLSFAENLIENVVGHDDTADGVLGSDRRLVTSRNARREPRDRGAQRQRPPVRQRERLEENVDETVLIQDVGRRYVDNPNLTGSTSRCKHAASHHDRVLEMGADDLTRLRAFRRNWIVEHK